MTKLRNKLPFLGVNYYFLWHIGFQLVTTWVWVTWGPSKFGLNSWAGVAPPPPPPPPHHHHPTPSPCYYRTQVGFSTRLMQWTPKIWRQLPTLKWDVLWKKDGLTSFNLKNGSLLTLTFVKKFHKIPVFSKGFLPLAGLSHLVWLQKKKMNWAACKDLGQHGLRHCALVVSFAKAATLCNSKSI